MPNTPKVFCAVRAVIAVAAYPVNAVTVLMSPWIPAPPPLSEPATIKTLPLIPPLPVPVQPPVECCYDIPDDGIHQVLIVALCHDANDWLGPGFADQQAADAVQPGFTVADGVLHEVVFQRSAAREPDILQQLGQRVEDAGRPR